MAKNNRTHILVVLDRSGSMESMKKDMEGGLNHFVEEQKKVEGECTFTLVQFDSVIDTVYDAIPLDLVPSIVIDPRGSTALLDAMGQSLSEAKSYVEGLPKGKRPKYKLACIVTDGLENTSREWRKPAVTGLVAELEKDNWVITYLGANQDAISVGGGFGLRSARTMTYAGGQSMNTMDSYSNLASQYRGAPDVVAAAVNFSFTEADRANAVSDS